MTGITAKRSKLGHARIMQRVDDEAEYVLAVLLHMRDEVAANPELYDPDAEKQINEAIARVEYVRQKAPKQELKIAA